MEKQLIHLSKERFLSRYEKPTAVPNNYVAIFSGQSPSVVDSIKTYGEETVTMVICGIIIRINESYNVKRPMTESQIIDAAKMISDMFRVLKIDDLVLWEKKCVEGDFGQPFDRIDRAILKDWAAKYFNERCEEAEAVSVRESQSHKQATTTIKEIQSLTEKHKLPR